MKALLIGATGATGKDLVNILLQDPYYTDVVIFVRRSSGITHPKLSEVLTDFDQLEDVSGQINGNVLFSCLGTTLKAAGSKEKQRHIDLDIPLQFAEIARRNGVPKVVLLSAYGASASSRVFYSKLKGELEEGMSRLAFEQCVIFRPGLLLRKNSDRLGERISASLIKLLNGVGLLRKFRPLPTAVLAEKLAKAPHDLPGGKHIIELTEIFKF
ncbi:NAD(P)H-binding protein [Desertivirga xinjiangensis]|uniref:NAD(P)H-binding protein n=1 Tax=Desertivirga xinjiangensis TaxID=539206 RepID=UPI00210A1536|nr:NAD(P)H-binding protein [Pedobacter xinjiangensis]